MAEAIARAVEYLISPKGLPYYENPFKNYVLHTLCHNPGMDYGRLVKGSPSRNIPKRDYEVVAEELMHDRTLQELVKRINPNANFTRQLISSQPAQKVEKPVMATYIKPNGSIGLEQINVAKPSIGNQIALPQTREQRKEFVEKVMRSFMIANPRGSFSLFQVQHPNVSNSPSLFYACRQDLIDEGKIPNERCEKYYGNNVVVTQPTQLPSTPASAPIPVAKPILVPFAQVRADDLRPQEMAAYQTILERFIKEKFEGEYKFYISERNFDIFKVTYPQPKEGV
jgi:hypothetical protein